MSDGVDADLVQLVFGPVQNVVARLEGTDARDEVILYMAHWDHLGTQEGLEGDNIFNGAFDNATGRPAASTE